MNWRPF